MPKLDKLTILALSQAKLASVIAAVNKELPKDSKIKIKPVNRRSGDFEEGIGAQGFDRFERAKSELLKLNLPQEAVNLINNKYALTKITKKKAEAAEANFDRDAENERKYAEDIASGRRAVTPDDEREAKFQKEERGVERAARQGLRKMIREDESKADKAARERDEAREKEIGRVDTPMMERKRERNRRLLARRAEEERDKKVKRGEAETPTLLTPGGREAGRARTADAPGEARERVQAANRARVARAGAAAAGGGGGAARAVTPVATTRAGTPTFTNRPNPNARNPNVVTPPNENAITPRAARNPNAIIG